MVYREKTADGVTRLTGQGGGSSTPGGDATYWLGVPPPEDAVTGGGWSSHTKVPVVTEAVDPQEAFTPVAGGIQFNFPGTYEIEAECSFPTVSGVRYGFGFYTTGNITPLVAPGAIILGGSLGPVASAAGAYFLAKTTVVVKAAGATVKMQSYAQTTTSTVCTVYRIMAQKVQQGAPGPQGIQGLKGDTGNTGGTGPQGTRWGKTSTWVLGTATNAAVSFPDGLPPRVNDLVVGDNGFDIGQVSIITNVVDATHADLVNTVNGTKYPSLRGPAGPSGTASDAYPVGSLYFCTHANNPSATFGGTWERYGKGKVMVGYDDTDPQFSTVGNTGGEKTHKLTAAESGLPAHTHATNFSNLVQYIGTGGTVATASGSNAIGRTLTATANAAADAVSAHENMPPYITVYIWRRLTI